MTLGIPFVSFDLDEGRKIASDAAVYAENNCPLSLASRMQVLIDDSDLRLNLSKRGEARAASLLRWETERANLLAAYELVLGETGAIRGAEASGPTRA